MQISWLSKAGLQSFFCARRRKQGRLSALFQAILPFSAENHLLELLLSGQLSMDSTDNLLYLIEEVRRKVTGLEKAVNEIHHVKKSLKVTSADVKAQIRDSISRHLEALRNREIWLLSQVELIQQGKEEVLFQKQAEIIEMVGGLKKVCALLEQNVEEEKLGEVEVFEAQLSELLTSVGKMTITPEETPSMHFKAHNLELLESIRGFGQIEAEGSVDQSQLASQFSGINLAGLSSSMPGNKRKFFTSSGPMENWLLHGQRLQKNPSHPVGTSVETWLNKCKPYCESEQESSSEMGGSVKSFDLSELKWVLSSETSPPPPGQDTFGGYFKEVKGSSLEKWVKICPKLPEQPKSRVIGESFSKIVAMGNENWLLYKQEKSNQRNFPENLGKIHKLEGSKLKWLKRLISNEYIPPTSTGRAFNIEVASMDQWLQAKRPSLESEQPKCNSQSWCVDCDCASTKEGSLDFSDTLSDADWLKVKEGDIVPIENLDSIFRHKNKFGAEKSNWLAESSFKQGSCEEDMSGIKKYNQMLQAQPIEDWVQTSRLINKSKENFQSSSFMQGFLDFQSNDYNKWLSQPFSLSADTCKWLARSSVERCKNCPKMCSKGLFTMFDDMKEASNDRWLKKSSDK